MKKSDSAKVVEELLKSYGNNQTENKVDLSTLVSQRLSLREQPSTLRQSVNPSNLNFPDTRRESYEAQPGTSRFTDHMETRPSQLPPRDILKSPPKFKGTDANEHKDQSQVTNVSFSRGSSKTQDIKSRNSQSIDNVGRDSERNVTPDSTQRSRSKREVSRNSYEEAFEIKQNDDVKVSKKAEKTYLTYLFWL